MSTAHVFKKAAVIALALALIGCGGVQTSNGSHEAGAEASVVEMAITNEEVADVFQRALHLRWEVSNSLPDKYSSNSEVQKDIIRCIDAELEVLAELEGVEFEDEKTPPSLRITYNA